jgi:hypothetical protein
MWTDNQTFQRDSGPTPANHQVAYLIINVFDGSVT